MKRLEIVCPCDLPLESCRIIHQSDFSALPPPPWICRRRSILKLPEDDGSGRRHEESEPCITCLSPTLTNQQPSRDHRERDRRRSRSPDERDREYRRERSPVNGSYDNNRAPPPPRAHSENTMSHPRENSQQERRVYVGNLTYDVKWHHLKDFMREGTSSLTVNHPTRC